MKDFLLQIKKDLIEAAMEMKEKDLPEVTEELFSLFEKTGNRVKFEAVYFRRRKYLTVFGVLALWMKKVSENQGDTKEVERVLQEEFAPLTKKEVIARLEEALVATCDEECWALPAHVDRAKDANWRNTVDLFASETAGTLTELATTLVEELSSEIRERCLAEVKRRVVEPFFASEVPFAHWEVCDHNWNSVCVGNIGSAAIRLYGDEPEKLSGYMDRVCEDLTHFIDGYAEDGTCMEGLGYYAYGMSYFVNFANDLYHYSNGERDLLRGKWHVFNADEADKRSAIAAWWAKCFFVGGRSLSFSDASSEDKYRMGLGCALDLRFRNATFPDTKLASGLEEDHCYRFVPLRMDVFSTMEYLAKYGDEKAAEEVDNSFIVLPSAKWVIGNTKDGISFACKGGHNDEPHNHNDLGSFLYVIGDELLLTDLGAGEYVKEYFREGRYNILCNRSMGHNIPLIDGKEQCAGKEYAAKDFEAYENSQVGTVSMELSGAYEACGLASYHREFSFYKGTGELCVTDTFVPAGENVPGDAPCDVIVTQNLVTQHEPMIIPQANRIVVRGEKECVTVDVLEGAVFQIKEMEHSNHSGEPEKVYLIQWDVRVHGETTLKMVIRAEK